MSTKPVGYGLLDFDDLIDKTSFRKGWKRNAVTTEIKKSHSRSALLSFLNSEAGAVLGC